MIMAIMKLTPFLSRVNFLPSSFISSGRVTVPIMVKVVIKADVAVTDAPTLRSDDARGNEIREGMCNTAPSRAVITTPPNPDCSPIIREILSGGTNPSSRPIKIIITSTASFSRRVEHLFFPPEMN